jgi:hypothetical protein
MARTPKTKSETAPAVSLTETAPETEEAAGMFLLLSLKDIRAAAVVLNPSEVRFLVDFYYTIQNYRIRSAGQVRASVGEPNALLKFVEGEFGLVEKRIVSALDTYTDTIPHGRWLKANYGIGPVIAAGLVSHIDIEKAPTAGHIWRFAGLDPTVSWGKGEKRPWNADLKVLCWKAGQSFVKFSGQDKCFYGKIFRARKDLEVSRNEAGSFAEQAARILTEKKIGKETEAYKAYIVGKLPPGQIQARAERYAVKMFISHLQTIWYFSHYGTMPPKPYVIEHKGHVDYLPPPCREAIPGLEGAIKAQYPGVSL